MVVDSSEDMRSREEFNLHQLMAGSRILVGAVSHEIRNVCGAIAVVHQNLARSGALAQNKDFEALGTLILALEKIAAMDLRQTANQAAGSGSAVSARRAADHRGARAAGGGDRSALERRAGTSASLGGPAEFDAGFSESHQEQRTSHVESGAPGDDGERPSGERTGRDRVPGHGRRRSQIRSGCSGRSSKARRPPAWACICPGRSCDRSGATCGMSPSRRGASFIVELSPLLSGRWERES